MLLTNVIVMKPRQKIIRLLLVALVVMAICCILLKFSA